MSPKDVKVKAVKVNLPEYPSGSLRQDAYQKAQESWWLHAAQSSVGRKRKIAKCGYSLAIHIQNKDIGGDSVALLDNTICELYSILVA